MKTTYKAFSSVDEDTWWVVWEGTPGDSWDAVMRIAKLRIKHLKLHPASTARLLENLRAYPLSIAHAELPFKRFKKNYLPDNPLRLQEQMVADEERARARLEAAHERFREEHPWARNFRTQDIPF